MPTGEDGMYLTQTHRQSSSANSRQMRDAAPAGEIGSVTGQGELMIFFRARPPGFHTTLRPEWDYV